AWRGWGLTDPAVVDGAEVGEQPPPVSVFDAPEVRRRTVNGVELVLVGTAHVSAASVELVRSAIAELEPDRVCLELDEQRLDALRHRGKWAELDVKQVIRRRQVPTLLLSLLLASWQKRLGAALGIEPGAELLAGALEAESRGIAIDL